MAVTDAQAKEWVEQWRVAGPELEALRRKELRDLTPEKARRIVASLLSASSAWPRRPRTTSGLVEQQRLFHRR